MSWGVRRIEEEPTGHAYGGQRRPAMTVGEWLETVSVPQRAATHPQPMPQPSSERSSTEALDRKLEELNRRLKQLAEASRGGSRDRDRDRDRGRRRPNRDQQPEFERERERGRGVDRDPVNERLDQIDKRLQAIAEASRQPAPVPEAPSRNQASFDADAERLQRGIRDIERLQADFAANLRDRGPRSGLSPADQEALEAFDVTRDRQASPVAQMISKLEDEVRGLRQSVEKRLETVEPTFDDRDIQDMRRMLERLTEAGASRQESDYVRRLLDEMGRLREVVMETGAKVVGPQQARANQESRLADMVERLAAVATAAQEKTSDDMRSLDRRLGDVADRMAELEGRGATQKDLVELQRTIDAISLKLDHPPVQPKPVIPAALLDLDIRIEKLGEKLDRIEPNPATQRQMATLESEIAALRFDFAQSPASRSPDRFDDQLRSLGERIDRLASLSRGTDRLVDQMSMIGERIDRLAAQPNGTERIADQISLIGERIDRIDRIAAQPAVSDRLEQQIKAMSERIERMSAIAQTNAIGSGRLETFEGRIGEIVGLLDRMAVPQESLDRNIQTLHGEVSSLRRDLASIRPAERNPEFEDLLRSLSQRLETAAREKPDARLLANIEDRIAKLGDMLAEQHRPVDVGSLEAKLGKLEALLLENRADAVEAASAAARDAVKEFAALVAESRASDADLKTIEIELRQVQAATRSTESRTSDALQSVHDALTTIVGRLGAIERAAREPSDRIETTTPRLATAQDAPTQLRPPATSEPRKAPIAAPTMAPPPVPGIPPERETVAVAPPPFEDTRPLEPGSGKPQSGRGGSVAPGAAPDAAGNKRGDFIAAARRAALAASQAGPGAPPPVQPEVQRPGIAAPGAGEPAPKSKSLFKSLFKGKQKALMLAGVGIAAIATVTPIAMTNLIHTASLDQKPNVQVASVTPPPSGTPVAPVAAANDARSTQVAANAEALALAPPTGTTTTFAPPSKSDDATRQAALANAMKQAAAAEGIKTPATDDGKTLTTGSVHAPTGGDATRQPMPPAVDPQGMETPKPAEQAATKAPAPTEKIGSLALRTAAASGDPKAQFEVAMRFSEGKTVPTDMREASAWFLRAAQQHFAPAAYRLGSSYEKGLGVDRSVTEAKRWYREAAEAGNVRAMHNLGVLYANERDMAAALPWFQKAGEAGLKDSQFNLGIIYALGSGVKQDLAVSYKWFALAAAQGDQEAVKKRDDVATHLDHTALASAKMAVSTWRPTAVSREANEETAVWSEPAATAANPAASPHAAAPTAPIPPAGFNRIMQAQAALQGKGLYTGKIDGELTPETRNAIRAFQKKSGLRQTGEIDPAFLNAVTAKQM